MLCEVENARWPAFFSILLGSLARQIAYNPFGCKRSVTDTVRNPNASIAGAGEDQSPISTECRLDLVQPIEMSERILRHRFHPTIHFDIPGLCRHATHTCQFFPDPRYQGFVI